MSEVLAELRETRERTAEAEQATRDARFRAAVVREATERKVDANAALELVHPGQFVFDDEGTPLNVKQIIDGLEPYLVRVTEEKAAAAAKPLGERRLKRGARMEQRVKFSRRSGGSWVS